MPHPPKAGKIAEVAEGDQVGRFSRLWRPHRTQNKMVFVYVIKSENKNFRYVGITNNISKRLDRHNTSRNISTKNHKPFVLIHSEQYNDYKEARTIEKFLKSGIGRNFLDSLQ